MRKTRKQNRWLALALCLCMLASVFPLSGMTYAAEQGCNHVHDENCGYVEAVEGQPCTFAHAHDDTCGFAEAVEALPCSVEAAHTSHDETCGGDPDTGEGCAFAHVHDDACGYAEAKESAPCSAEAAHIHDENCGYIEAVKGQPCTHVHDETCGGLAQDSGPVPCTKTEGCTLEDGHEGECDADSSFSLFSNTDAILEVTFDSNLYGGMPGGLDSISNAMNTAVATALTTGKDKTAITTIRLTGSATEITGWNWCYLMELYQGSEWPNLSVLDLSGMTSLDKIENRTGGSPYSLISNLTEVRFPASLQTIGTSAFYWCKGLTSVSFPTGLETIGNNAFYSCDKLESAPFPASLQTIGAAAFSECSKLNSADLSGCQNLEGIPSAAFSGCSSLNAVSFPASLKTIGDSAFSGCSNLNALTFLGNKPPDTGTKAFLDVASDGGIVYPAASSGFTDEWKNNTLGADWTLTATGGIAPAFSVHPADQSKNAGETAVFSVTATGAPAPSYQWQESTNSGATWTDITDGGIYSGAATATLTLIGVRATHNGYQYRCVVSNMVQAGVQSNAATLTVTGSVIKATVNLAGHDTFKSAVTAANIFDVTAVTSLAVTGQTNGGTWRTTDREYLKAQFTSLTELDLSGYTGEFSSSAFEGCTQLAKVTMPTGSYAVSEYMFYNCKALKDIDVSGATSFGERAFFGCTSLTDVTMPTGSYAVPEFMFQNCTALKDIDVSGATSFGERAFSGCASLTDVTMPTGGYAVSEYVFQNCTALKDIDVSGATSFGNNAFNSCTSLTDVKLPGSYAVSVSMFERCTALKDIDVSGATSFGWNAFKGCTQLANVKLPGSYAMSESMFQNCTALKDIDVSGATSFDSNVFKGCTSLKTVKLSGGLSIPQSMFLNCAALETLAFMSGTAPSSVGTNAFLYVPISGTVYHPTGQNGYDTAFNGTNVENWRFISTDYSAAPSISIPPTDQSKKAGETAVFSVTATGDPSPGYQWQVSADSGATWTDITDGGIYSGATTRELTLAGVQTSHNGYQYRCVVSNILLLAGVESGAATLTVTGGSTGGGDPTPSTYSLTVRAGTGGKITQGASGNYEARKTISIEAKADAGYKFTGWTSSNGGGFANSGSISTTFIMPANATTVTATFQKKDPGPSGPDYTWQTLIDHPSGVRVSGLFTDDAKLEVKEMLLHLQGDCPVCDNIRERQENGELIVLFDIALKSGKYKGDLDVEIPVGGQYNGQSIVIIHCKDKVLDSRTVTVENGMAKGAFSSLSPYAAAKVSGKTVITGLPESYTLLAGQSVSWTPSPAGGAWSYDTDLLEMTRQGDTYTFKALKEGKATATYTVDGVPFTVTIAVNSSIIPQTGDVSNPWPWTLLATAALLGCAALVLVRRGGYKKRHG